MAARTIWRRLAFGLPTILGLRRRGFFIPYRYASGIAAHQPAYAEIESLFAARQPSFLSVLQAAKAHAEVFSSMAAGGPPPAPRFDQSWFPTLDAVAAYTLVRHYRPRRIVEVGSGHSTRFLARAVADGGFDCRITAIDPAPRAALAGLAVDWHRTLLGDASAALFANLEAGDILFIDSSHILMPGTDVDFLFSRVVPRLSPGVLLHVHDVFLPDDYPPDWAWRGYNEQQVLPGLLFGGWEPLFASHYVASRLGDQAAKALLAQLPQHPEARPASLWLRRTG